MEEQPRQFEQIEALSKLADSIVHEMNNVLATIMGLASVLEAETDIHSSYFQDVQGILAASRKGLELTRNLVGFAHRERQHRERVSINNMIGLIRSLLQRTITPDVEIVLDLDENLPDVTGDPNQIKHAIMNLALNAKDAVQNAGTITLTTRSMARGAHRTASTMDGLEPGSYVRIQVSDTGPGMDAHTLERAFEPFFSTKPPGTATGLGLSLVFDTVKRHSGHINVFSKPGMGTTVSVYLPTGEPVPEAPVSTPTEPTVPRTEPEKVLLVEDEDLVRAADKRLLHKLGYEVVPVKDGETAIQYYKQMGQEFSFVLLDLIMPEMDGADVLRKLKEIDPEVRVVLSSGYAQEEPLREIESLGAAAVVRKPYTLRDLAEVLKKALK